MRVAEAKQVQEAIGKHKPAGPDWGKLREMHKAKMNGTSTD